MLAQPEIQLYESGRWQAVETQDDKIPERLHSHGRNAAQEFSMSGALPPKPSKENGERHEGSNASNPGSMRSMQAPFKVPQVKQQLVVMTPSANHSRSMPMAQPRVNITREGLLPSKQPAERNSQDIYHHPRQPPDKRSAKPCYEKEVFRPSIQPLHEALPLRTSRMNERSPRHPGIHPQHNRFTPAPQRSLVAPPCPVASPFFRASGKGSAKHASHDPAHPWASPYKTSIPPYKSTLGSQTWQEPKTLNGLSFIDSPRNVTNQSLYQRAPPRIIRQPVRQSFASVNNPEYWGGRSGTQPQNLYQTPSFYTNPVQSYTRPREAAMQSRLSSVERSHAPAAFSRPSNPAMVHTGNYESKPWSRVIGVETGGLSKRPGTNASFAAFSQRPGQYATQPQRTLFSSAGAGRRNVRR